MWVAPYGQRGPAPQAPLVITASGLSGQHVRPHASPPLQARFCAPSPPISVRPGLVSTALSARSRSSSPQALMPDGSQSARGIPTFASKPWSPAVPHDRAVVASVPFPAYRTAASAAVPAARQHTSPIRYQQPFTPIVARPYQMASAPAVPMPPVQFRPPAQTLQESPEVDSEYSPRDSVWKRYFCNPTKAQTGGSSLPPAMPPKVLPMEKERAPSQPAEAASLRSQRPETGSTPQTFADTFPVSAGSLPEAPDDRLDLRAQSQLLPPDSPLPGSTPTPEAKVSAAAPADTPQSMVSESPSLTKRRPCVGVTSQAPSRPTAGTPEIHERSVATSATSAADPLVAAASGVVVEDLTELASMPRPHPAVQRVAECVLMLLGFRDSSWAAARSAFESADIFQERLQAFRAPRSLSRLQFQKLQRSLEAAKAAWSDPAVANRCRACLGLEQWCRAVAEALAPKFEALANSSRKISTLGASTGSSSVNGTTSLPGTSRGRDVPEAAARTSIPIGLGDLIITPNIYALQPHELRRVRDLTICRPKVGEVTFHGDLDLVTESNILEDLPHVLRLEPGEVVLYPDSRTKPREGKGLNRPATITLFRCLPPSGAAFPDEESKVRYRNRIAQMTEAKGARFVDYDCDQGLWQFRVDHF